MMEDNNILFEKQKHTFYMVFTISGYAFLVAVINYGPSEIWSDGY